MSRCAGCDRYNHCDGCCDVEEVLASERAEHAKTLDLLRRSLEFLKKFPPHVLDGSGRGIHAVDCPACQVDAMVEKAAKL